MNRAVSLVLVLLLVNTLAWGFARYEHGQREEQDIASRAAYTADQIQEHIEDVRDELVSLSTQPSVEGITAARCRGTLPVHEKTGGFSEVVLQTNRNGQVIGCSSSLFAEYAGLNIMEKDYFRTPRETREPYLTIVQAGERKLLVVAVPRFVTAEFTPYPDFRGEFNGVFFSIIDLQSMTENYVRELFPSPKTSYTLYAQDNTSLAGIPLEGELIGIPINVENQHWKLEIHADSAQDALPAYWLVFFALLNAVCAVILVGLTVKEKRDSRISLVKQGKLQFIPDDSPLGAAELVREEIASGARGIVIGRDATVLAKNQGFVDVVKRNFVPEKENLDVFMKWLAEEVQKTPSVVYLEGVPGHLGAQLRALAEKSSTNIYVSYHSSTSQETVAQFEKHGTVFVSRTLRDKFQLDATDIAVLKLINDANLGGKQVAFQDVTDGLGITRPTTRVKISGLLSKGLIEVDQRGRFKVLKVTPLGRSALG